MFGSSRRSKTSSRLSKLQTFFLTPRMSVCDKHTFVLDMHTLNGQLLTIDTASRKPIYEELADGLTELIARGELKEGVTLTPVRQLAAAFGAKLTTIPM